MTFDEAAAVERILLDYGDSEMTFEAYVAMPAGTDRPRPCVLLGHAWDGRGDDICKIADRIAALGFVAFALDLYGKGVRGEPLGDNSHLMAPLMADRALLRRRLLLGHATAAAHPSIDAAKIVVMGYCFGGLCALDLARAAPANLRAAISIHGGLQPPDLGTQGPIDASILMLHGWEDPTAPPADILSIAHELTDAGADWQLHAYGHAMHAFTFEAADMPERGIVYDETAARRAWNTVCDFLAENLGPAMPAS